MADPAPPPGRGSLEARVRLLGGPGLGL